jgi:anti-anti-sigma factor
VFEIKIADKDTVVLLGRFDASHVEEAESVLAGIDGSCTVDCEALDYISSGGIGVLLVTEKRLSETGHHLKLKNLNRHIRMIFEYAELDSVLEIE